MDPYVGEIRMFGGNFAPSGWALCDGSLLDISTYQSLFSLIGTTYGGDGQSTFALPELRGRIPINQSIAYPLGNRGGAESVSLTSNQIPAHTHTARAQTTAGTARSPEGAVWAQSSLVMYAAAAPNAAMQSPGTTPTGGSQPHDNIMPYLCVNFIIALEGIWPPQN